jgi:hypothetical protein
MFERCGVYGKYGLIYDNRTLEDFAFGVHLQVDPEIGSTALHEEYSKRWKK